MFRGATLTLLTISPFRRTEPSVRDKISEIQNPVNHWAVMRQRYRGGSSRTTDSSIRSSSGVERRHPFH